ncbi:hypothetical protein BGZ83_008870 [Gryganskiella cystojenkinii]|nr:hypothetical protein BGZ83_008870 [Gryganskiella cystojenkinii]
MAQRIDSRKLPAMPGQTMYNGQVACLLSLSIGYVIGSPNIPEAAIRGNSGGGCGPAPFTVQNGFPNCLEFSDLLWGFAIGCFCLGACVGGLFGGTFQTRQGRLRTMAFSDVLFILGSLVISLSYHQAQFIIGRVMLGFACGLAGVVTPTYLNEISTARARGTLGTFHQLFLVVGLLISNLVGLAAGTVQPWGWRVTLAVNGVPALIHLLLLKTTQESPKYLIARGQMEVARQVLQKLRGPEDAIDVGMEFLEMARAVTGGGSSGVDEDKVAKTIVVDEQTALKEGERQGQTNEPPKSLVGEEKVKGKENLSASIDHTDPFATIAAVAPPTSILPSNGWDGHDSADPQEAYSIITIFRSELRPLAIVGITIHFLQQASGINGLVYYSTSFLSSVFGNGVNSSRLITLGISCCNLVSTTLGVLLINRLPRKTLMLLSFAGISLSALLLVVGAYANIGIMVVIAVFLYIASFAVALGPIPWMLLSEFLPTYAVGSASAVATAVNWGSNFIIGLVFPTLSKAMGHATFILFGAFTTFGFFYVWFFVPETRNRSVESVLAEMAIPLRKTIKKNDKTLDTVSSMA